MKKGKCRYYSEKDIEPLLDINAIANLFRVSRNSAYRIISCEDLTTYRLFGKIYYFSDDIINLINIRMGVDL